MTKARTLQQIYAQADARLTVAERETRSQKIEESTAMIRAALDRLPADTGLARSQLRDAISELNLRAQELRGTA